MKSLNERLKEIFAPPPADHDWCDTTRLANPWSVLLGSRRVPDRSSGDTSDTSAGRRRDHNQDADRPATTDLRDVSQPPPDRGGAA